MSGGALLLRRTAIFATVAGLGTVLAWMLAGGNGGGGARPSLSVARVPEGTLVQGSGDLPRLTIVGVENPRVGTVRPVVLDDGTTVDFRPVVFRGESERPLPSPAPGVERLAVTRPVVELREEPRTRTDLEAGRRTASRFEAPRGVIERGPGDSVRVSLAGGVVATSVRGGESWTFRAPEAEVDVPGRALAAPGEVEVSSRGLEVRGRDLLADEDDRSILLRGGAEGTVERSTGAGLDGADPGEARPIRFRSAGPFRILPLEARPGDPRERFRILMDGDAAVVQADGRLAADHIEVDLARDPGAPRGTPAVEEIRAYGSVSLEAGGEARRLRATCGRLAARPAGDDTTIVRMEESPALRVRLAPSPGSGGPDRGTLVVDGSGPATFRLPRGDGPVHARFTGGARAVQEEPAAGDRPALRRDLRAADLTVTASRSAGAAGGGSMEAELVVAEGEAVLLEGPRSARADRIRYSPLAGGGSLVELDSSVAVVWPAAGAVDPLSDLGAAPADPAPRGEEGTLLLASPGRVRLEVPEGEERGAAVRVEGGGTLRRVVGEREVYRLAARALEADFTPGYRRALSRLAADGAVRFEGRGEGPGGRRYAFTGARLLVTDAPGEGDGRRALLEGGAPGGAAAELVAEDGRPFRVAGDDLEFDRGSGRFRATGKVSGAGILPGGAGAPGADGRPRHAVLECADLVGAMVPGEGEGTSRLSSLEARGGVRVRTEGETASGETLHYDAAAGVVRLRGSPARVTARAGPEGPAREFEDRCESPELLLEFRDGTLVEARADRGGRFVRHLLRADPGAGGTPSPPERVEASCEGPLVHRPAETSLSGGVTVVRSALEEGSFREKDRMEEADEVRAFHPPDPDGSRTLARVVATSTAGSIRARSAPRGWDATGVARVELDAVTDRMTLESSRDAPRFRLATGSGTVSWFRRAVYDYRAGTFPETVGVTIRGGGER